MYYMKSKHWAPGLICYFVYLIGIFMATKGYKVKSDVPTNLINKASQTIKLLFTLKLFPSYQNNSKSVHEPMTHYIVSKFNLQKGDLIRLGQLLFLLFFQIRLFIYFHLGLRLATEKMANPNK